MRRGKWDLALWVMATPILAGEGIIRTVRHLYRMRRTRQGSMPCRTCGAEISLLGFWRCPCGFTYRGHLLRRCSVCGSLPVIARCLHCGATEHVHL
jgi:hypothetical protein